MKKIYLLDGSAMLYRSHFAFIKNPLYTKGGQCTSAVYGVVNSMVKLMESRPATHVVISFDLREKTFRHKLDPAYKAQRPPMPDELVSQIEPVKEFFRLMGVPIISLAGYEADDVLATLAEEYKKTFDAVEFVTGDKDYIQLLDTNVTMWDPCKQLQLNLETVPAKYDLTCEQFLDYLALMGDSADNIPGVAGIGKVSAQKLLAIYGNLDNIYAHADEIKGAMGKKIIAGKDEAYRSQVLARIKRDVPIDIPANPVFDTANFYQVIDYLQSYELTRLAGRIEDKYAPRIFEAQADAPPKENSAQPLFICVDSDEKLANLLSELKSKQVIAVDTETTGIDAHTAELVGVSICSSPDKAYYIPLDHNIGPNLDIETVLPRLEKLINQKTIIGHNIKYDYIILQKYGWCLTGDIFDTMLASYLGDPARMRHGLDMCASLELDYEMMPISALIGTGKKQISFACTATSEATDYAAEDAWATFCLYHVYKERLAASGLHELFEKIEMPLVYVLTYMELAGVYIDTDFLKDLSVSLKARLAELTGTIYTQAGSQFNINSTQQLAKILFEDMGIKPLKKTKTGYSTDVSVLKKLAHEHQIARDISEYRELAKLDSTYVSALPRLVNETSGRVHSSFNQTVTSTGRLSSNSPNLQNIPIRTSLGRQIRKAFVPMQAGWSILAADYSQIELRLMAIMAGADELIAAFNEGADIHARTAGKIYQKPLAEVTREERSAAKTINFGILYGMGSQKLSQELKISVQEAKDFIENYFAAFPQVKDYISLCVTKAQTDEYSSTIMGRRLALPNINSGNKRLQSEAERVAVNMPIQGSAADIIKRAMIDIFNEIAGRDDVRMIIQVHDELVFEVKDTSLEEIKTLVIDKMQNALPIAYQNIVSLVVDVGIGKNWLEAH